MRAAPVMPPVPFTPAPPRPGERDAYDVAIGGRTAARLARAGRRWRLEYGGIALTVVSFAAAGALVRRFADKILEGRALDLHELP